jgi:hypothetical protein
MEFHNSVLGLVLILMFALTGFTFTFHFWRYDPITVTRTIELDVLGDDAVAVSVKAMTALGIRSITVESAGRSVLGRTGLTMRSLGTQCRIDISPADGSCVLVCRCWPRAELALTDWGAGRIVLDALVGGIDRQCAFGTAPIL